jgi:Putative ABC exporter
MAINLVAITAGTRAYTRGRKVLLGVLVLAAVALLFQASQAAGPGGFGALMDWLQKQRAWQAIAAPLRCFAETFLVEKGDWLALARWGALAAGIDCLLIVIVLALDAHYLESAAAVSERIYTQIQRLRRGEGAGLSLWGNKGTARWSLPGLPWWGGIGPIAWRQMITATRNLGRLALLALVLAPVMIASVIGAEHMQREQTALMMISSVLFWLTVILSTLVPFDFRGDLDRMDVLKTLPIRPWRLAVGQLLTPVLLVSAVQCLILGVVMIAWGEWHPWLVTGIAFTLPFNFLLFGLDNLLFLWFPSRLVASNPGDFQALGRNVLFLLVKLVFLGVTGGIAVGLGLVMFLLTEKLAPALAVGWSIASLFAAALVPMLALAFHSFDVSRDTPA